MSLSKKAKEYLIVALTNKAVATEIANEIDSLHAISAAAHVASIGVTAPVTASAMVAVLPAAPTAAEVDTAIDQLAAKIEVKSDAIEAKIDAILAALQAAAIMA